MARRRVRRWAAEELKQPEFLHSVSCVPCAVGVHASGNVYQTAQLQLNSRGVLWTSGPSVGLLRFAWDVGQNVCPVSARNGIIFQRLHSQDTFYQSSEKKEWSFFWCRVTLALLLGVYARGL